MARSRRWWWVRRAGEGAERGGRRLPGAVLRLWACLSPCSDKFLQFLFDGVPQIQLRTAPVENLHSLSLGTCHCPQRSDHSVDELKLRYLTVILVEVVVARQKRVPTVANCAADRRDSPGAVLGAGS